MKNSEFHLDRKICSNLNASGLSADTLRHFLAVAETQSFSMAAESLGLEVASVSRKIKNLEERLGVRLFDRMPGKNTLTLPGVTLLERSRVFLSFSQKTINEIRNLETSVPPIVRIAYVSSAVLSGQMCALKSKILEINRYVEFDCIEHRMDRIPKLVRSDCVDFGLVRATHEEFSDLNAIRLTEEHFCIAMRNDHRLVKREMIAAKDLALDHFILPEQSSGTLELAEHGGFEPNCVSQPGSLLSVLSEVGLGHGIAVVPSVVMNSLSIPNVIYRPIKEELSTSGLTAVFRRQRNIACLEKFISTLSSEVIKQPDRTFASKRPVLV